MVKHEKLSMASMPCVGEAVESSFTLFTCRRRDPRGGTCPTEEGEEDLRMAAPMGQRGAGVGNKTKFMSSNLTYEHFTNYSQCAFPVAGNNGPGGADGLAALGNDCTDRY